MPRWLTLPKLENRAENTDWRKSAKALQNLSPVWRANDRYARALSPVVPAAATLRPGGLGLTVARQEGIEVTFARMVMPRLGASSLVNIAHSAPR